MEFSGVDEIDFVAGSVLGFRAWSLVMQDEEIVLRGQRSVWPSAEFEATCDKCGSRPAMNCTCGVYSFFTVKKQKAENYVQASQSLYAGILSVVGVVENYGVVVTGDEGCRAGKSRIRALALIIVDDLVEQFDLSFLAQVLEVRYGVPVFRSLESMNLEFPIGA